jgi:hypothetical protein
VAAAAGRDARLARRVAPPGRVTRNGSRVTRSAGTRARPAVTGSPPGHPYGGSCARTGEDSPPSRPT